MFHFPQFDLCQMLQLCAHCENKSIRLCLIILLYKHTHTRGGRKFRITNRALNHKHTNTLVSQVLLPCTKIYLWIKLHRNTRKITGKKCK